jgi:soluble lytic murein transglycosylase
VAQALEREDVRAAARELESVMAKTPPPAEDVPRWQFMLGRLRERAGDERGALAAYELAAAPRWPLAPYAALAVARMRVRTGQHPAVLAALAAVPEDLPIAVEARLLRAESAFALGDFGTAIRTWRAHLATERPAERGPTRLRLADALLASVPSGTALGTRCSDTEAACSMRNDAVGLPLPGAAASTTTSAAAPAPKTPVPTVASMGAKSPPTASAAPLSSAPAETAQGRLLEALSVARRERLEGVGDGVTVRRAEALEKQALQRLPAAERLRAARLTTEEELVRARALVDARLFKDALAATEAALEALPKAERNTLAACELALQRGKAHAGQRQYSKAAAELAGVVERCKGPPHRPLRARALYLAGLYHSQDGRWLQGAKYYEAVEKEAPEDTLGDDARLKAALCYFEQGVEARFTELLDRMPEDFPDGDMVLEGVYRLAVRRMEKGDWSGAASVLERGSVLVGPRDGARGTEFSGRERYWRARAFMMTGEKERGLAELESIVRELPLSYYMLHAHSRLLALDPARAERARREGLAKSEHEPFAIARRPEFDTPGFVRAKELLRLGETEPAKREIDALGLAKQGAAPEILWGVALLYAKANAAKLSHDIARGLLTDWLVRWPSGAWTQAWELAFPRPFLPVVQREAKKNGVPEALVYGIMREESSFDPTAVSPADAHGLMQLIPATARLYGKPVGIPHSVPSLYVPANNVALGARALGDLSRTFAKNPLLAIPAYNAGPGRPRKWVNQRPQLDFDLWVELIPYRETLRYTKRVLAARAAYAYLYDRPNAEAFVTLPIKVMPDDG